MGSSGEESHPKRERGCSFPLLVSLTFSLLVSLRGGMAYGQEESRVSRGARAFMDGIIVHSSEIGVGRLGKRGVEGGRSRRGDPGGCIEWCLRYRSVKNNRSVGGRGVEIGSDRYGGG